MSPPTDRAMGLAQISMSVGQCHDFSLDPPGVRGTPERKNSMFLGGNTHGGVLNQCNATQVQLCGVRPKIWVWGCFRGLWWFITPSNIWQLYLTPAYLRQLCLIRRDEHFQIYLSVSPRLSRTQSIAELTALSKQKLGLLRSLSSDGCSPPTYTRGFVSTHPKTLPLPLCWGVKTWPQQITHCFCKWPIFCVINI